LKSYLNKKQIAEVQEKFSAIDGITDRLVLRHTAYLFKNEQAREYARHEFARRLAGARWSEARHVACWHETDVAVATVEVCFAGRSENYLEAPTLPKMTLAV